MELALGSLFEKPISGEWGNELLEGQVGVKVIRTTNFTLIGRLDLLDVVARDIDLKKYNNKLLKKGDIIIEKSGGTPLNPVGRVVHFDVDGTYFCNNFTAILRPKQSINSKYALYLMLGLYKRGEVLKYQNKTTGIANLKINDYLTKTKVNLCSLKIQSKIVQVLDAAQLLIDKRKQQIETCDELIKSRFVEMFGDPTTNPKGWEKRRLADECDIVTGNTPSRNVPEYYGDYIEWIKSDNINTPSSYLTTASEYLSEKGLTVGRSVETGSVLMTCIAGSLSCIGNVAIADRKVSFNQQINAIVPKKNNTWFMFELFEISKPYIQSTINMALKGILNKGQLSEMEFIFPPVDLQNDYAEFCNQVNKLKLTLQKSLTEVEDNFNVLMQKAFKGELFPEE